MIVQQPEVIDESEVIREFEVVDEGVAQPVAPANPSPRIGLEQYYIEAGPDYAAWSHEFNMHFGYYRAGANPLNREAMLEQMNAEVLARLQLGPTLEPRLLDLGCGLGATLRSFARRLPHVAPRTDAGTVAGGART
jgi:MPBQ/MSBQ methyltransferase